MFKILQKSISTGVVTGSGRVSGRFRGKPVFDFARWRDARPAADVCPTGAITVTERDASRQVTVDYGACVFCGLCAEASPEAVTITQEYDLAVTRRDALLAGAEYTLNPDGTHASLTAVRTPDPGEEAERLGAEIRQVLGRSLAIREVDAGSCNGCELEIVALNNPVYDAERFGIHFVASPRHADALLVTGPVTRGMELALRKTYDATPDPKLVIAVGACGISGGIFGVNYATRGAVDQVIPVDVYVPGCPPRPQALLQGILKALHRRA